MKAYALIIITPAVQVSESERSEAARNLVEQFAVVMQWSKHKFVFEVTEQPIHQRYMENLHK